MKEFSLIFFLFFSSTFVFSQSETAILNIEILGNNSTKKEIILREVTFQKNKNYNQDILKEKIKESTKEKLLLVINKIDLNPEIKKDFKNALFISAKNDQGIQTLKERLLTFVNTAQLSNNDTIVTNLRHYEELQLTLNEINAITEGLNSGLTGDFLAINIRQALFHLGSITGEVTTDILLENIFGKFCIGK